MDYKGSYLHLRRRRKEISEIFLNNRSKIALKKTILPALVPNCGPLAGVGGGTNPPNLPPAYAHAASECQRVDCMTASECQRVDCMTASECQRVDLTA